MTLGRRSTLSVLALVLSLPVLIGLGAAWKAKLDVADLAESHAALEMQNASYRAATEALAEQIAALQSAVTDINSSTSMDPNVARSVDKLPSLIKSRAMGGGTEVRRTTETAALSSMLNTEDTFGLMRTLLESIESRLSLVRTAVDRRNALAAATPAR